MTRPCRALGDERRQRRPGLSRSSRLHPGLRSRCQLTVKPHELSPERAGQTDASGKGSLFSYCPELDNFAAKIKPQSIRRSASFETVRLLISPLNRAGKRPPERLESPLKTVGRAAFWRLENARSSISRALLTSGRSPRGSLPRTPHHQEKPLHEVPEQVIGAGGIAGTPNRCSAIRSATRSITPRLISIRSDTSRAVRSPSTMLSIRSRTVFHHR